MHEVFLSLGHSQTELLNKVDTIEKAFKIELFFSSVSSNTRLDAFHRMSPLFEDWTHARTAYGEKALTVEPPEMPKLPLATHIAIPPGLTMLLDLDTYKQGAEQANARPGYTTETGESSLDCQSETIFNVDEATGMLFTLDVSVLK